MTKSKKITVKQTLAVVEKAHVFLEPAQEIFTLANGALKDLQKSSNKSHGKKAKVVFDFAKKATAVASEASKKHKAQKRLTEQVGALPPQYEEIYHEEGHRYEYRHPNKQEYEDRYERNISSKYLSR